MRQATQRGRAHWPRTEGGARTSTKSGVTSPVVDHYAYVRIDNTAASGGRIENTDSTETYDGFRPLQEMVVP